MSSKGNESVGLFSELETALLSELPGEFERELFLPTKSESNEIGL